MENIKKIILNGVETEYYISDNGEVWHHGKILSQTYNKVTGYMQVGITGPDGKRHNLSVHRYVALTFIPNPNNLPVVNHIDGNKTNNNINNLEWTTMAGNMQHALKLGLVKSAGIDLERAKRVCVFLYNGYSIKKIAKTMDLSKDIVQKVYESEYYKKFKADHDNHDKNIAERISLLDSRIEKVSRIFENGYPNKIRTYLDTENYVTDAIEVWSDKLVINGHPTYYRVSNFGRVLSEATHTIMRPYPDKKTGFACVTLYDTIAGKHIPYLLHRLVANIFLDPPEPSKREIRFKDGDRSNCHATNLEWISINERRREIQAKNGKYGCQKLTEEEVHKICKMLEDGGYSLVEIGLDFGVSKAVIGAIKRGKNWKHISCQYNIPYEKKKHANFTMFYDKIDKMVLAGASTPDIIKAIPVKGTSRESYRSLINQRRRFYLKNGTLKDIRKE